MQTRKLIALALAMGISSQLCATDTFDMGKVQVVGKDAQTEKIDPAGHQITMDMGERNIPMPELVPETGPLEFRPMTEKQLLNNFHRENKDELSVAAGIGTRGSNEIIINGRGSKEGYVGDLTIRRERRDGFRSSVDTSKTGLEANVSSSGEDGYTITAGGEYSTEEYAQRGMSTVPSPDAGIENRTSRISLKGNSTLEDGSFVTGRVAIDSIARDIKNPLVSFSEEQTAFSIAAGATYLRKLTDKFKGRAALDLKKDDFTVTAGADRDFTKTVFDLGGVYDVSEKATANFGLKRMSLMSKDATSPYASLDYRFSEPWQLVLSYEEDLGNDSVEKIFMPSRYVAPSALMASHKRTASGALNYRTRKGDTMGIELFKQTEEDGIEYLDFHNPGKRLLESQLNFVDEARRSGISLRGSFKIEDNFRISLKGTAQTTENNQTGQRLSYEPKRLLDVGFNYSEGKLMLDFTRR
ncbi:MAG: hypothetical protein CVV42_15445, partial [Candidatus Riflebacteria bacterium HGW-Riflebacteria-2]